MSLLCNIERPVDIFVWFHQMPGANQKVLYSLKVPCKAPKHRRFRYRVSKIKSQKYINIPVILAYNLFVPGKMECTRGDCHPKLCTYNTSRRRWYWCCSFLYTLLGWKSDIRLSQYVWPDPQTLASRALAVSESERYLEMEQTRCRALEPRRRIRFSNALDSLWRFCEFFRLKNRTCSRSPGRIFPPW